MRCASTPTTASPRTISRSTTASSSVVPRPPCVLAGHARRDQRPDVPDRGAGPGPADRDVQRVADVDLERPVRDPDLERDQRHHGLDQSGDRHRRGVGHQERVADRDDDLHADRDQRRRVGDRDRHRHRRRHAHDADDHLEYSRQHHLRDGVERDAAERDHDGRRDRGRIRRRPERCSRRGRDRRCRSRSPRPTRPRYNSATATVAITVLKATPLITWANAGRHQLRDAARRHAVERDRERGRDVRVHAAERDGARRRRRPDALGDLHADRRPPTTTRRAGPCRLP